jgi:hypothetical protein
MWDVFAEHDAALSDASGAYDLEIERLSDGQTWGQGESARGGGSWVRLQPSQAEAERAGSNTSPQPSSEQRGSSVVRAALSWLMSSAIEGFAAYAQAMHPCIVYPSDNITRVAESQSATAPPDQFCPELSLFEGTDRSNEFATEPYLVSAPTSSRIARFWSTLRWGRTKRLGDPTPESLDEAIPEDFRF